MTTTPSIVSSPPDLASLEAIAREIRGHLAALQRAADAEIRSYPTPIPRCDAQFNHIYELRAQAMQALQALDAALARPPSRQSLADAIAAWQAHGRWTEGDDEQRLRERVAALLAHSA